ncbi:MAG: hypothetical protein ACYDA6_09020, partial [Solirubrobacteraceae bacterium]
MLDATAPTALAGDPPTREVPKAPPLITELTLTDTESVQRTTAPSGRFNTVVARQAGDARPDTVNWRTALAPYARPHRGRATIDVLTSIVPYLGMCVAMYY